jgi:hypothetical protein
VQKSLPENIKSISHKWTRSLARSKVSPVAKTSKKNLTISEQPVSEVIAISEKLPFNSDILSTTTAGDQPITMIKRFKTKAEIMEQELSKKR